MIESIKRLKWMGDFGVRTPHSCCSFSCRRVGSRLCHLMVVFIVLLVHASANLCILGFCKRERR